MNDRRAECSFFNPFQPGRGLSEPRMIFTFHQHLSPGTQERFGKVIKQFKQFLPCIRLFVERIRRGHGYDVESFSGGQNAPLIQYVTLLNPGPTGLVDGFNVLPDAGYCLIRRVEK
jgi:hypothetical protein